jgi:hemerythrin-like domain-containing protein
VAELSQPTAQSSKRTDDDVPESANNNAGFGTFFALNTGRTTMKCIEIVIQDHGVIRRGVDILEGMMKKLEDGERIEISDVKGLLKFLQAFGDGYHQSVEEKSLFPALVRATPQGSPVHELVLAHGEERALVDWMLEALSSRRVVDFVYSSRRYIQLIRNHMDKEESVLGKLAEQLLPGDEDDLVAVEFNKNFKQPECFVNFSRLEGKYPPLVGSPLNPQTEVARAHGAGSEAALG